LLKSRFESIFPADYDLAAVLVREVGDQLLSRLDLVALKPQRILEIGCGTGHCTQLLKKRYPTAELLALDDSPAMLAHAEKSNLSQVNYLCVPFNASLPIEDNSIDLIVANLILPWCTDLKKMLQEWRRVLRPEGLLILSTYGLDTLNELQEQVIQLPHFIDMHDLGDVLVQTGFAGVALDVEHFTLTYREQQSLENELRLTGFIATQTLQPLQKNTAGVIPLTYEIVYAHAWKPEINEHSVMEEGIVKFPLAHLRKRS
jgi:malonyl-CoA O-methyltransferase